MNTGRISYEDSCRRLQDGYLDSGDLPPLPDHIPQADDPEPLGISLFKTFIGDGDDLGNLTIPRTFIGRSEINRASFRNSNLSESNLCWNDFTDVDFTDATLAHADMRSSSFAGVIFINCDLQGADLRRSSFNNCSFDGANLIGTSLARSQKSGLKLSASQVAMINWCGDDGPEPNGG